MDSFIVSEIFPISIEILFKAWLDSDMHAEMIGSSAEIDPSINVEFKIWDNYISGRTIEIIPNKKIVQKWRTTEFSKTSKDSILELEFTETMGSTKLTLKHSLIPDGQGDDYKNGWIEYYFAPMKEYFDR